MSRTAAFFDLDRTVVACNTGRLLIADLRRRGEVPLLRAMRMLTWLLRYHFGLIDVHAVANVAAAGLQGQDAGPFLERFGRWAETTVLPLLLPIARRRVQEHRKKGHLVALLTTSPTFIARPVAMELGCDEVISTQLEVVDGRFTGRVVPPTCYGAGKVTLAEELAAREQIDLANSWFYTDSFSDLPMLERVGHRVVVNPDPRLRRAAQRRGWTVETWMEAAA